MTETLDVVTRLNALAEDLKEIACVVEDCPPESSDEGWVVWREPKVPPAGGARPEKIYLFFHHAALQWTAVKDKAVRFLRRGDAESVLTLLDPGALVVPWEDA